MEARHSQKKDAENIMSLFKTGQESLSKLGVNQWQDGYPNMEIVFEDINTGIGYVFEENGEMIAAASLSFAPEKPYDISKIQWEIKSPYAVIHRIAVIPSMKRRGIAVKIFSFFGETALSRNVRSLRVDTCKDNTPMCRAVEKFGFVPKGIIVYNENTERLAFEKIL